MNFSDERYVRLYVRDTTTWILLGWEGQAVFALLMRKLDRAGVLDLSGIPAEDAVAAQIGMPIEIVRVGISRLLERGVVTIRDEMSRLLVPNFLDAQEAAQSDKARQRESRAKRRDVTKRDDLESQNVTKCHGESHAVTSGHSVPSRTVPSHAVEASDGTAQRPRCPDSPKAALELPAQERAAYVLERPDLADWLEPRQWPEICAVNAALAKAQQRKPARLGAYTRDAGVRTVVGLLADGWPVEMLEQAARAVVQQDWWKKKPRGLASLTHEVVRRALEDSTDDSTPEQRRKLDQLLAQLPGGPQA